LNGLRGTNPGKTRVLIIAGADRSSLHNPILAFYRMFECPGRLLAHPLGHTLLEGAAFPGSIRPLIPPLSCFLAELLLLRLSQSLKVTRQWPVADHQRAVHSPEASAFSLCPRFQALCWSSRAAAARHLAPHSLSHGELSPPVEGKPEASVSQI